MKPFLLLIAALAGLAACSDARWDRSFVNWGAIVWRGEIVLTGTHIIDPDDILLIEPGTIVRFARTNADLMVEGSFICAGTPEEPILFVNDGPPGNSVILFGRANPQNNIAWTSFGDNILDLRTFCSVSHVKAARITTHLSARPVVTDSVFGLFEARDSSAPRFANCRFDRAGFPSLSGGVKNIGVTESAAPAITNCSILGHSGTGLPAADYTAMSYSSTQVNLKKNWWGTADTTTITNSLLFRSFPGLTLYQPVLSMDRPAPSVP